MSTEFVQLNHHWNADPNAPYPSAEWAGADLKLRFYMNAFRFPQFSEEDLGEITFRDCSRFRFGIVNDEGWYGGQCRFSNTAPTWGEFYELIGDLRLALLPEDWQTRVSDVTPRRHFLFYFRDEEFECDAMDWSFKLIVP